MGARIIVFSGNGGAGASTLAAATAAATAKRGRRTLAFGVGPGLSGAFAVPLGPDPRPVAEGMWALEAAPGRHDEPGPFLTWLRELLLLRNMDETLAEDIAALPGLADLARLLALEEQIRTGKFDVVVVDCPAIRYTLDLLGALDAAARCLDRVFPPRQPTVLDPLLRAFSGYAPSGEDVYEAARDLLLRLTRLREAFTDVDSASVRLVLTAGKASLAAVQRAVAALSLFGYPAEAAICNRLLPEEAGQWSETRLRDEQAALGYLSGSLAPLPVLAVPLQPRDVSGLPSLRKLAGVAYRGGDPGEILYRGPAQAFTRSDGSYVLSLALPYVEREDLTIERLDDALIVHIGERSRTFDLPPDVDSLRGVRSAFDGEILSVSFSQD